MAADHNDFIGQLATTNLADRVATFGIRQGLGPKGQLHFNRTTGGHSLQAVGIFNRHRCSRNLFDPILVAKRAGVRRVETVGGHRTNQHRLRPVLGRERGPMHADLNRLAVVRLVLFKVVGGHRLVDHHDLTRELRAALLERR